MKNILTSLVFFCSIVTISAQFSLEVQLGGSNFLGGSANALYDIHLGAQAKSRLTTSLGVGLLAPGVGSNFFILHGGLHYGRGKWGIGSEVSAFNAPFKINKLEYNEFVDLLVYPDINYTFSLPKKWFLRVSAGAYFAFERDLYFSGYTDSKLHFSGDVIPGAGISLGRRF